MTAVVWQFSGRSYQLDQRTLVMGIINVTPDSFSDGGRFNSPDAALRQAARMVADGADILDVGGESTRPGGAAVSEQAEMDRVIPVVERFAREFDVPVSVDTTKAAIARAALAAGAEIINDISGLRFEPELADIATANNAGLILTHSLGELNSLHRQPPMPNVFEDVVTGLQAAVAEAERRGVERRQLVLDPGIGFGKTYEQNLELVANFDRLVRAVPDLGWLAGTSRKSFIGRAMGNAPVERRLFGSLATVTAAVLGGAHLVRVHDVRETVEAVRVAEALREQLVPRSSVQEERDSINKIDSRH
jgi:dihydropteroate synthase